MNLLQLKHALRSLSLSQLRKLDELLHELIRRTEESDRRAKSSSRKKAVAEKTLDNKIYRQETVRWGKVNCKCTQGKLHGPYWYSDTRVKGKVKSQYIGKRLPRKVERVLHQRGKA